jgi:hypothetical protein
VAFHAVLSGPFAFAPGVWRLLAVTAIGMVLFVPHIPVLTGWLGPLLTGRPVLARTIPAWQLASDHLVYAWSILAFGGRGRGSRPRAVESEES